MDEERMKKLFYSSVAAFLALLLFWFGARFLFYPAEDISGGTFLLISIGLILGGIFMLTSGMGERWRLIALVLGLGFYFGARSTGALDFPWLARIFGAICWAAAFFAIYVVFIKHDWPDRLEPPEAKSEE